MFNFVFAQKGIGNPVAPDFNFGELITGGIGFIIIIAFILAFLFLIWGGLQWITSGGAPDAVESARNRIIQSMIGLTVVVAAWAIMGLVSTMFNIEFTSLPFPKLGEKTKEATPIPGDPCKGCVNETLCRTDPAVCYDPNACVACSSICDDAFGNTKYKCD